MYFECVDCSDALKFRQRKYSAKNELCVLAEVFFEGRNR